MECYCYLRNVQDLLSERICTWNTRGLWGSAASSQRPRENKLKYLKRIAEKSDIVCLQETHDRIEHLANILIDSDRATWMKFGTLTPGNVISGGSIIFARNGILGPDTDHLIRIRQFDCCCTVIDLHYQIEGALQELDRRLRGAAARRPMEWDFLLEISTYATLLSSAGVHGTAENH